MSFALALDLDATATVLARSAAEIPVVMPVSYTHLTLPTKRIV